MEKGIPFFKLAYGSRIALYGCGNNGAMCYKQLIQSGFCKLSVWVDENYADEVLDGEEIKPVSELKTAAYDHVLITIMDESVSKQIKRSLLNIGIDGNRIITMLNKAQPMTMECLADWKTLQEYLDDNYRKMYCFAKRANEYYPEIEAALIENICEKSAVFNLLKTSLTFIRDDSKRFILLVLMYQYGYFDKQCMEIFMKHMCNSEWIDDTYFDFITKSTIMIFMHPDYIYKDFYKDRKILQRKVCEYYKLDEIDSNSVSIEKNIAIVANAYVPNRSREAVSVLVRKIAMEFADLGYNVKIFVLRNDIGSDMDNVFLTHKVVSKKYKRTSDELTTAKGIAIGEQLSGSLTERLQNIVKSIMEYQPYFILDMADERFPEAYALIRHFPVINIPMRVNSYSSEADIYISIDKNRVKKDNCLYHAMPLERVREALLSYLDQGEETDIAYKRENFRLSKEDFVMVTVGRKLSLEIDDELIQNVCWLMNEKNNVKWILVGDSVKSNNGLFNQLLKQRRIIMWGYERYLENLYRMCDVYLNPNRAGAGVSIRRAMLIGLPIAMTDYPSDALPCMPSEYIVHGDYKELMEYVVKLYENQELYQRVSNRTLDQIRLFTAKRDAEKVLEICKEAAEMRKNSK